MEINSKYDVGTWFRYISNSKVGVIRRIYVQERERTWEDFEKDIKRAFEGFGNDVIDPIEYEVVYEIEWHVKTAEGWAFSRKEEKREWEIDKMLNK